MVMEHLFSEDWLEKKSKYAFLLGFIYSIAGLGIAKLLFPSDPALPAVAFTSLMMLPEVYRMFSLEERKESQEKKFSAKKLYQDNAPFARAYLALFLGILLAYSIGSMVLPSLEANALFNKQLEYRLGGIQDGLAGSAFEPGIFTDILKNNIWVLLMCFLLALASGDGAVFLITWNASVWGTVFGVTARNAGFFTQTNPLMFFLVIMAVVLPHVILEGLSYILAAISGGVISKDVLLEKFDSRRFKRVFQYNLVLLLTAVGILVLGALLETYVLGTSESYSRIVALSYG